MFVISVFFKSTILIIQLLNGPIFNHSVQVGTSIAITVVPGSGLGIHWQPSLSSPLLLISPGTGLTPCRALIQERYIQCTFLMMMIVDLCRAYIVYVLSVELGVLMTLYLILFKSRCHLCNATKSFQG